MSDLVVHPAASPAADGTFIDVTPASAGWTYVGFEVLTLAPGVVAKRDTRDREVCIVVVSGTATVNSEHGEYNDLGGRPDPWSAPPDAVYLPSGTPFQIASADEAEVALCWAPAPGGGAAARLLSGNDIEVETRGFGSQERTVRPILMAGQEADSLLVVEVLTPGGNWSSYPPHKHDQDTPPTETFLEETYYHRITPAQGFGFQRVYSQDRSLDETLTFGDRDCVLVPRGYHTVSAPPGYDLYYLNVMAGPKRQWAFVNDPDHEWRIALARNLSRSFSTMSTTATRLLDNYIAGRWTPAQAATEVLDVTNPSTGETLARVPLSGRADLDDAVAAARAALPEWRAVSTIARARKLFDLRERLVARQDEMARAVTTEMGKTIADASAEVARMIEMVEAACAIPTTMQGRILEDVSRNIDAETIRQPVGVCAAIVPFNFPAMVPFWFLPFAIACGNTFVLKPSEQVPLTQQIAFEELDGLGLPPGVVNLVNGGREIVEGILEHPGIDAVSFVGSAPVARLVYEGAAKHGKRVQALGGAKNHMVVMPDAVIDKTVDGILGSAFGAAGQRCMAGSVVVTVGDAHEQLIGPLTDATRALHVGDGLDESSEVGPVISCAARDRIADWVQRGVDSGATLVVDGRGVSGEGIAPEGAFLGPTVLDDVTPDMDIAQEEVFGPVLCVIRAETLDQAIEIVNSSRFGNGTSIFTESGASVRRYRHEVEAGMIGVNIGVAAPVAFFPFSGWKDSFLGDLHAHGTDAVEFFTRKKTVTSRYFSSGQGSGTYFVER